MEKEVGLIVAVLFSLGFCYTFYRVVSEIRVDSKLNVVDIACMVMTIIIGSCVGISGDLEVLPILFAMGIIVWAGIQLMIVKSLMKDGISVTARVVDYHVRTKVIRRRYQKPEKYQVYAPIMEYETDSGTVKASYPVFDRKRWYQEQDEWLICYNPSQPEFFWFAEREGEMTSKYLLLIIVTVLITFVTMIMCVVEKNA